MSWKESKVHLLSLPLGGGPLPPREKLSLLPDPWGHGNTTTTTRRSTPPLPIMPPPRNVPSRQSLNSSQPPNNSSSSNPSSSSSSSHSPVTSSSSVEPISIIEEDPHHSSLLSSSTTTSIEFDGNDQVLCRVCGDKASGFHYGVHSCEGCKGFFRRSIQQKIQYRPCTKNQQCNILRINRNRCQYCRLKKCIAAGMSRDAVRFGRVPKREKAKILAAMQSSRMKTQEAKVLTEMSDDSKIIEEIVRAHYDNCDYTRNKMEPFLARAKENPVYVPCTGMTCPMKGRPEDSFLESFSERFMDHVRQVCTFAKRIPGFECLHNDDKVTLLKSCVFEVLLVRLSGLFDNQSLVCLNGDIIRKETINQMPAGNAKFLMDSVFELAQRLNQFHLSDAEIGIFCAVVIITPDRPGLRNPELVQKMQNKLKSVLSNILLPQHSDSPGIFSELLSMVHDLRTLNTLHTEKFLQTCKISSELDGPSKHYLCSSNSPPHSPENDRRSPIGSVSSSESGCSSEVARLTDLKVQNSVLLNALARKRPDSSEAVRIPKSRKLDSPSDSGIDSPKNTSSSPRASGNYLLMEEEKPPLPKSEEAHPLLKRALQQPPQTYGPPLNPGKPISHFQDEVYKPHKKFRRLNSTRGKEESILANTLLSDGHRHSSNSNLHGSSSLLASTLAAPLANDQSKRNEMLASLILDREYLLPTSSSSNRSPPPAASSSSSSANRIGTDQPLNLSTRTPPPPQQHDISTEA